MCFLPFISRSPHWWQILLAGVWNFSRLSLERSKKLIYPKVGSFKVVRNVLKQKSFRSWKNRKRVATGRSESETRLWKRGKVYELYVTSSVTNGTTQWANWSGPFEIPTNSSDRRTIMRRSSNHFSQFISKLLNYKLLIYDTFVFK